MEKDKQRMLELLADQTLFGLTEGETAELEKLKDSFPDFKNDDSFERAAAAINLINLGIDDSLPAHLQTKLEAQAREFFAAPQKAGQFSSVEKNQTAELPQDVFARSIDEFAPKSSIWNWKWLGLAAAVTACIALAISLWLTRSQPQPQIAETPETVITPETVKIPEPVKTPTPELSAAQKREQLIASAPDVIQTNWTSAKGDKRVLGDVVWSNAQQKGYVRLRDMPILDASKETYQLWIFDDERNEKTPVSAGIFNVSGTGEVMIPINAQLRIIKPKQFAVTKEKAGGVVVTKPDRIVAVAKI